jgi:hypothetical protein
MSMTTEGTRVGEEVDGFHVGGRLPETGLGVGGKVDGFEVGALVLGKIVGFFVG